MPIESQMVASCAEQALATMSLTVTDFKRQGVGMPQGSLRPSERAFLEQSLEHLSDWLEPTTGNEALKDLASSCVSRSRGFSGPKQNVLRLYGDLPGLRELHSLSAKAARYLVGQSLLLDLKHWRTPLDALFFAACQCATHEAMRVVFGGKEQEYTKKLLHILPDTVRRGVVTPFLGVGPESSKDLYLQFATASMENGPRNMDLQGADLAIVIGTLLYGKPVWRVVLLQSKAEVSRGKSKVGQNKGAQLDEILSTGMGAYLFYPTVMSERSFTPTVRSAEHVFVDVYREGGKPKFNSIDPCGIDGSAWDLASFIALQMRRPQAFSPGRLFPSAAEVADVLSIGRTRPIVVRPPPRGIVFASTTPLLNVLEFWNDLPTSYHKRTAFDLSPEFRTDPQP